MFGKIKCDSCGEIFPKSLIFYFCKDGKNLKLCLECLNVEKAKEIIIKYVSDEGRQWLSKPLEERQEIIARKLREEEYSRQVGQVIDRATDKIKQKEKDKFRRGGVS
jgi:hypothetical protein